MTGPTKLDADGRVSIVLGGKEHITRGKLVSVERRQEPVEVPGDGVWTDYAPGPEIELRLVFDAETTSTTTHDATGGMAIRSVEG